MALFKHGYHWDRAGAKHWLLIQGLSRAQERGFGEGGAPPTARRLFSLRRKELDLRLCAGSKLLTAGKKKVYLEHAPSGVTIRDFRVQRSGLCGGHRPRLFAGRGVPVPVASTSAAA